MKRIYQGRVQKVSERLSDGAEAVLPFAGNHASSDQSSCPLWQHHEVFQDAINYYLVALAALAVKAPEGEEWRVMRDICSRIAAAWETFPREDAARAGAKSLRRSVAPWLELPANATLEDAFAAILKGNQASPQSRQLALLSLLHDLDGDIQKGSKKFFPFLCESTTKATFPRARVGLLKAEGKELLPELLWSADVEKDATQVVKKLQFEYFANPNEAVPALEGDDARIRLGAALENPGVASLLMPETLEELREKLETLSDDIKIPRYFFGGAGANVRQARLDLYLLAKHVVPHAELLIALRNSFKKPPASKKAAPVDKIEVKLRSLGDDPLIVARGQVGFVFPAFTSLQKWLPAEPNKPRWRDFDISAFAEALKSFNQFNQKTAEREDKQQELHGTIAHLLGKPIAGWTPPKNEAGEDAELPDPLAPDLLALAFELERQLTQSLSDAVVGEQRVLRFGDAEMPVRDGGWTITRASLRGLREISAEWNKKLREHGHDMDPGKLEEVVHDHQRDDAKGRAVGSVPMFFALCAKEFWPLWADSSADESDENEGSSDRFLARVAQLHELVQEFVRTQEPINLTPAEPRYSRRLAMLSDLQGRSKVKRLGFSAIEVSVATCNPEGKFAEQRIVLHFSAPRLHRDHLVGTAESRWLQPMVGALGLPMPTETDDFDPAVSLMPDFDEHGELRYLLNFVADINAAPIHEALGKAGRWKGNFNSYNRKNLHLLWPAKTQVGIKESEDQWWNNPAIIQSGFTVLAVDLGQRSAGAWAMLRISAEKPRTKRPVRSIGHDGKREWFAEIAASGLLRLPGEDAAVRGADGNMHEELSGKSGRMATEAEWIESKELAARLLAAEPSQWVGDHRTDKSFPEHNDALIALANRRLSRLATFHRWSCFDPEKPEFADRRGAMVRGLLAELEHWQDAEVEKWKQLLQDKNFAAFRDAAGASFARYRAELQPLLEKLANRVCPLRGRRWVWKQRGGDSPYGDLVWESCGANAKVRGQRGLSMARLEQLGALRRLFLRYNRSLDRQAGEPAKFGRADAGRQSGEPCTLLLAKIDRMKEQRIDQTAHLILAQALGVRLREHRSDASERTASDRHGEYAIIPGRSPVDFIVIENLDRYLTSQGRAPSENSRLMQWSHRAVREKIKMLSEEPFGIPVVEVSASYSSRFCAVTGEAGARCEERPSLDTYLRKQLGKRAVAPVASGQIDQRAQYDRLLQQFEILEQENAKRLAAGKPPRTLLLPKAGGPLFAGARSAPVRQADVNAATNLALRAVAAPEALHLLHKVRAIKDGEHFAPKRTNSREKAAFANEAQFELLSAPSAKLQQGRSPNFFYDAAEVAAFDRATLQTHAAKHPVASGVGLWRGVNDRFLGRIIAMNDARIRRWQPDEELPW